VVVCKRKRRGKKTTVKVYGFIKTLKRTFFKRKKKKEERRNISHHERVNNTEKRDL